MNAIKAFFSTLWGLLVDDARLAIILAVALIIAACVSLAAHQPLVGAIIIWLGLLVALYVSIEHQLRSKIHK